jgi:NAD(P)-dependent dehydrogenase (short-subunit alcohol dehydrogenase family)
MNNFQNLSVIITGGSSGIGRAAAIRFSELGAKVLITGRRSEPLRAVAREHPNIEVFDADVTNPNQSVSTIAKAVDLWGRIDVLINNAAAGSPATLEESTEEQINTIFSTNVTGPSLLTREALPYLKESKGTVINISSTFGHKPAAGIGHYAASKAALEHLTRCWALELAPDNIRVNGIAPGPAETAALEGMMGLTKEQAEAIREEERKKIPLGRRGRPDEVARWIGILADPASEWVTGQIISVDGGLNIT